MPQFPVIAFVAALLVTGCMSGPNEEKLPGAPAVRAATP
jgi:hypothetical protein